MTRLGDLFLHEQEGYRLAICDRSWAFEQIESKVVVAQAIAMPDHATAMRCALMCARVYVPDFYPEIVSACDKLLDAAVSSSSEPEFRAWLQAHHFEVVNAFLDSLPGENRVDFALEDLLAFGRRQFTQHLEGRA